MKLKIEKSWEVVLSDYTNKDSFKTLWAFVENEHKSKDIFPVKENIFNAFSKTPFDKVKVVILGQDPYHGEGQAHGLSFSVPEGVNLPPSLKNIYKEINSDLKVQKDINSGNLEDWADQGVLLLNSVLTVEKAKPGSHAKIGWEEFTDEVIRKISSKKENVVFMLWGNYAKQKGESIDRSKHLVLESAHPSPFSAYNGFFGSKHFSKTNLYLKKKGKKEIEW